MLITKLCGKISDLDLDHILRWDLLYFAYSEVGPSWNGVAPPAPKTTRTLHMPISGAAHLIVEDKRIDLLPGHLYYIPSDLPTERVCEEYYESYFGFFHCRDIGGQHLLTKHPYPIDLGTWDMDTLGNLNDVSSLSMQLYIKYLVLSGLILHYPGLAKRLDKVKDISPRIRRCLGFIDDNLSAALEVRNLAKFTDMSRNAFTRTFKAAMGVTPRAYLNSELNQWACRLVLGTDMSIRQIGEKMGFRDEYYFNRFFKKMNNVPPLRFRKSYS